MINLSQVLSKVSIIITYNYRSLVNWIFLKASNGSRKIPNSFVLKFVSNILYVDHQNVDVLRYHIIFEVVFVTPLPKNYYSY